MSELFIDFLPFVLALAGLVFGLRLRKLDTEEAQEREAVRIRVKLEGFCGKGGAL